MTQRRAENTWTVKLYLSGPIERAKQTLRRECLQEGLCVTVEPTLFIYTGGEETGYVVGLVNYPKHPSTPEALESRAEDLLRKLISETFQRSGLMVSPSNTVWIEI